MSDYVENVEIGVHLVVDEKSAAEAREQVQKQLDKVVKPGQGGGGGSRGPSSVLDEVGKAATKNSGRTFNAIEKMSRAFRRLIGPRNILGIKRLGGSLQILGTWASRLGSYTPMLLRLGGAFAALGGVVSAIASAGVIATLAGAFTTMAAAIVPLLPVIGLVAAAIAAVVAVVWALSAAWEAVWMTGANKKALQNIEEIDRAMAASLQRRRRETSIMDQYEQRVERNRVGGVIRRANRSMGSGTYDRGRYDRDTANITAERERQAERGRDFLARGRSDDVLTQGKLVDFLEHGKSVQEEKVRLVTTQVELNNRLLESERKSLEVNKRALATQRETAEAAQRLQENRRQQQDGLAAQLFDYDSETAKEITDRLAKLRSGNASDEEIREAKAIGIGQDIIRKAEADSVRKRLGPDADVVLNKGLQELSESQQRLADSVQQLQEAGGYATIQALIDAIGEKEQELDNAFEEMAKSTKEKNNKLLDLAEVYRSEIDAIDNRIAKAERDQEIRAEQQGQ